MADTPPWKRLHTPQAQAASRDARRTLATIRNAMYDALDELGAKAYLKQIALSHPPAFVGLLGKMLPVEVEGSVDHTLTVKIVKQIGEREIVMHSRNPINGNARDAITGKALPVVPHRDRDPTTVMPEVLAEVAEDA